MRPLYLPELDGDTRSFMVREFDREQLDNPFVPPRLSWHGRSIWPAMMRDALESGDDVSLISALLRTPGVFVSDEAYVKGGIQRTRRINIRNAAEQLGTSEFNTWYVRGFAARLLDEGVTHVKVHRAASPKWSTGDCTRHEGLIVSVQEVYDGHRARYWPADNPCAFSVPFQPGCHHSIERVG